MDCFGCTSQMPLENYLTEELSFFFVFTYVCILVKTS